ncbi:MAG: ABC-2 transporter permease, partial [Anaeroplasmataceae bacterium]|nr:ABC-2 transporter permease [Anaeroplasmataceae bacterium]
IIGAVSILNFYSLSWNNFSSLFGFFMLFLMFGIIYIVFSYNKKRISADMTYSLPVTKRDLFVGKYLASLASLAVMAILYLFVCLILFGLANMNGLFDKGPSTLYVGDELGYFVLGWLIHISITIPLFNFLLLFYYKANTVLDGIVFVGIGLALVFLITQVVIELVESNISMFPPEIYVSAPYQLIGEVEYYYANYRYDQKVYFSIFITLVVLGYLISGYLFWFSEKDCSVRTQGLSNGIFGYRVFLPLTAGLIPIAICISEIDSYSPIWFFLTAVGLFIAYCIYHRSVKFNKESYIVFASALGFDFIFLIFWLASR